MGKRHAMNWEEIFFTTLKSKDFLYVNNSHKSSFSKMVKIPKQTLVKEDKQRNKVT